jgi:histone acetyltransferase (RNA polymerase elongator complex component)
MSLHINRFVDAIKAAESRNQRDFTMSMRDAKDLHADITKLLLALQQTHESTSKSQVVEVVVSGGTFKST